jgi:cell wall-associated NlpC family hydrolase
LFIIFFTVVFISNCGGGGSDGSSSTGAGNSTYDYTTTVKPIKSQTISASSGGVISVTDNTSLISGVKLTIPPNALQSDTKITIAEVNNPPEIPTGKNFVGTPIDLGPDGTKFTNPLIIEMPYTDEQLRNAGISDDTALNLYCFDKSSNTWSQADILSIDTVNNKIQANIYHFSYLAITGLNGTPPADLGIPQPGDLLFKTGSIFGESKAEGWRPGHVGIYTGEKQYTGTGLCSEEVKKFGKYNVVEALNNGVQYSYYNLPNVKETYESNLDSKGFGRADLYMGAREPVNAILTAQQRTDIVAFVESQVGKPYAWTQTYSVLFGMLKGSMVKGPLSFNCVGLAEAAYEYSGFNGGDGLVDDLSEGNIGIGLPSYTYVLTPAEQYNRTKSAGGILPLPTIKNATLTPSSGTPCTEVLAQISVSHPEGLSAISSVIYVTDGGYTNPTIFINDKGLQGDLVPNDGIYTTKAPAGGDASSRQMGLNFTVTDIYGKTDKTRMVYTYTGTCISATSKSLDIQETTRSFQK